MGIEILRQVSISRARKISLVELESLCQAARSVGLEDDALLHVDKYVSTDQRDSSHVTLVFVVGQNV